jgi:F-type H+-transporting ATPase subunit epsilon
MAEKLLFELVSPEKLLLSEQVAMVVVPGSEGNFGVLPGHSLLISTVRPGVIDVYEGSTSTISERIFVSGGFAEVTPERCTVLADEARPVSLLDRAAAEAERRSHETGVAGMRDQLGRLSGPERDHLAVELRAAEAALAVATAKLAALEAASGH